MPKSSESPTIHPSAELKHALTDAQTDYLEKFNKQFLELTGVKV